MTIEEVKNKLKRSAVIFHTGDAETSGGDNESWIGKIVWKDPNEEVPLDRDGTEMIPLASFFIGDYESIPFILKDIRLCNVYISKKYRDHLSNLNGYCCVHIYRSTDSLIRCDLKNEEINPLPLFPELINDDYPMWECVDDGIMTGILELEKANKIEYYGDIVTRSYDMHKVGGYPAYIQDGSMNPNNDFVFQISSDPKAGLNIVDNGSIYFFYVQDEDRWIIKCDYF